ncbi:MAG: hypothetical protein COA88_15085 [Kordia sp.]|nr:MAG: hypothetical protein COA88_15085 [Kordia sp.]
MINKLCFLLLLIPIISLGQSTLNGELTNIEDVEGIHVFNKTYHKYTITDASGKFKIPVRINDTVAFSGIQYDLKIVVITKELLKSNILTVALNTKVNELDEVYLGYRLTGSLGIDAKYIETEVPMEIALTNSFRGLGVYSGTLSYDGQSRVKNQVLSSGGGGINLMPLVGLLIPKKKPTTQFPMLAYSRDALVAYYGGDFFSGHLKILKTDEERFIHFTELDSIIVVSLKRRNEFELLHRILQLREQFETDFHIHEK